MTVKITKPELNLREVLSELSNPTGTAGLDILRAETPQEVFNYISAGRKNLIINGDMRIAQAGTSITTTGTGSYQACDRWRIHSNKNQTTHTLAQVEDAPEGFNYSLKLTVGTGATSTGTDYGRLYQRLEVQDVWQFGFNTSAPKPFTLSFWVKSSITGTYGGIFGANGTGVYVFSYTVDNADVWEYKTITVNGITTMGQDAADTGIGFGVHFDLGEGPDRSNTEGVQPTVNSGSMGLTGGIKILATSGATWQITGVQLELGKVATPFEYRSYGEELALCRRYYEKISGESSWYPAHGYNTEIYATIPFTTAKRDTTGTVQFSGTPQQMFTMYGNTASSGTIDGVMTGVTASSNDINSLSFYVDLSASTYTPYGTSVMYRIDSGQWIAYINEL